MSFTGDISKITNGPAWVSLDGTAIGHTQGGVSATISPQNRMRTVDQFGSSEIAVIHTGDQARITVPFTQWEVDKFAEIYNPGLNGTTYFGFGRIAGYVYTTKQMKIIPFVTTFAALLMQFEKATPIGEFSINHTIDEDRVMEVEYAALIDTTQPDGAVLGRIFFS